MGTQRSCSFCGKPDREVARLCEGPRAFICNECVVLCMEIFREHPSPEKDKPPPEDRHLTCSFCGKDERDMQRLIAGPTVFICDCCAKGFAGRMPAA